MQSQIQSTLFGTSESEGHIDNFYKSNILHNKN